MKKIVFLICSILATITLVPLNASDKKAKNPYTSALAKRIHKKEKVKDLVAEVRKTLTKQKTKVELIREIAQLRKSHADIDDHYQEEVREVREELKQAEQERDTHKHRLMITAIEKDVYVEQLTQRNSKILNLEREIEAFVHGANAQNELIKLQREKLQQKRDDIKKLKKAIEELGARRPIARSNSMVRGMYA